jgi:hypothetical protein
MTNKEERDTARLMELDQAIVCLAKRVSVLEEPVVMPLTGAARLVVVERDLVSLRATTETVKDGLDKDTARHAKALKTHKASTAKALKLIADKVDTVKTTEIKLDAQLTMTVNDDGEPEILLKGFPCLGWYRDKGVWYAHSPSYPKEQDILDLILSLITVKGE